MSEQDKKSVDIYEDEIHEEPFIDERGNPIVDREDILEGIDLDKDLEDLGLDKVPDDKPKEKITDEESYTEASSDIVGVPDLVENDPDDILQVNIKPGSLLQRTIEDPTENDDLYRSLKNNDPTTTVLNHVMVEIAEEAAYLKTWRRENYNLKEDLSDISNKRILILKKLVETIEKKEKLNMSKASGRVDFHSENFQKVFGHFLEVVKSTFEKVNIPAQYDQIFFSQLAKDLDGFEDIAERIYSGKKVRK
jgi:hypothetical protein